MESKDKEPVQLNPRAVFSKTGKGVQEASGKTSHLSRADRNVLKEIDGKTSVQDVGAKFEKIAPDKFEKLIQQFDKDGFIREISHEAAPSSAGRPSVAPRSVASPPRATPPPGGGGDDMDFTAFAPKATAAAPKGPAIDLAATARADSDRAAKEKEATDYRARQEAEAKAKAEAEARAKAEAAARARAQAEARAKAEAAARAHAEAEAKARAEAAARMHAEAASKAQADANAKVKAAREAAVRMATEAKARADAAAKAQADELNAKLEQERKAREDAERRAREAADEARRGLEEKARRDAEELRQKLEAEMKAKLEEERAKREAEDRMRREEDERRRKEEDERRAREDAERKAREEADRKRREEEDRKRREDDERRRREADERRAKEDAEKRARDEAERKRQAEDSRRREEDDRKRRDEDDRRKREESEARGRAEATAPPLTPPPAAAPAAPAAAGGDFGDSLLADLDSFGKREEEEQKAKEEAERKAKEEAERKARAQAERKAKEAAEQKKREAEERRRKEEEERRAQEEQEQRVREEEEERKRQEAERKRKAKEALAAKQKADEAKAAPAADKAARRAAPAGDDDIGVTEDDLGMDDVKRDEKKLGAEARKAERERAGTATAFMPVQHARKPVRWGKPVAIALFVLLAGGLGFLQVMPLSSAEYQKAASDALGVPVTIRSARLSVLTGVEVKLEGVAIGDAVKISTARGYPGVGSVFGAKKSFSRIDLEGLTLPQGELLAAAVLGKAAGENFSVEHITAKGVKFDGPLALAAMDVEAKIAGDGSVQSIILSGADKLNVKLTPSGSDIAFEIGAGSIVVPFVPALTLSDFGMKGVANRAGVSSSQWDGRAYDGMIGGSARIRWGGNWTVEGDLRMRGVRVAVFAPTLVSEGKVDGKGAYSMSGPAPAKLFEGARVDGNIKIENGVLGSFDLTRALQTGGAQTGGRTVFSELTAQGVYDKGSIQMRNIQVTAGNMNGGASLDVDPAGTLSGRIVADVKTPSQQLRATLNISGKIQEPVIRK